VIGAKRTPTYLSLGWGPDRRREVMKKLILFVTASVIASGTWAYAQDEQPANKNVQLASYHRVHHSHGYGRMDDQSAEGRTSG